MIPSLVGTHDTDTAEYFEDTRVTVKRCARGSTEGGTSGTGSVIKYILVLNLLLSDCASLAVSTKLSHVFHRLFVLIKSHPQEIR